MSDSIIGKENISFRKKRIAETSQSPSLPQTLQFAHKFAGGESSFSLLNLTTPTTEMPGFTNPAPALMSASGLASNPAALKLYVLTGVRYIPFDSYRALGTTIVFLKGVTMSAGAVVFGEIDMIAPNPIVVGDGRFIRKTYSLAVGATTVPLGFQYKVGVNLGSSDQIGDIKVYRNGTLQLRNVGNVTAAPSADGNFQEIDAGNGFSVQIKFNNAPTGQPDSILVEMGYQISSGQVQLWAELERLQGGLLAIAQDAAIGFDQPLSNYLSTNATELDRRAFGDNVVSLLARTSALESPNHIAASYWPSANRSPDAATPINFDSRDYDTRNAVTTGAGWRFTAPLDGKGYYRVSGVVTGVSGTVNVRLYKNGTYFKYLSFFASGTVVSIFATELYLDASDFIDIRTSPGSVIQGNANLATDGCSNITISRIGI